MVLTVPGIHGDVLIHPYGLFAGRMVIGTGQTAFIQRVQEQYPSQVQVSQELDGVLDGSGMSVGKLCPKSFFVRPDGGIVFRKGQPQAGIGVDVAIRNVVNQLPDGPAVGTVGSIQLVVIPATQQIDELGGQGAYDLNVGFDFIQRIAGLASKLADRVA